MKLFKFLAGAMLISTMASGIVLANDDGAAWVGGSLKKPLNQLNIGFSFQGGVGGNIYVVQYVDKLKEIAGKYGMNLTILDAENDPAKQSQQMPDLISQQPNVIIVWAANGKAIVPAIKQAHDAGVPVVTINAQIDPSGKNSIVAHAGPNDYNQGVQAAETLVKAMGEKGNIVEIRGTIGFGPGDQRAQAVQDVVAKYPNVKILDVQAGNWSQGQGQSIMELYHPLRQADRRRAELGRLFGHRRLSRRAGRRRSRPARWRSHQVCRPQHRRHELRPDQTGQVHRRGPARRRRTTPSSRSRLR